MVRVLGFVYAVALLSQVNLVGAACADSKEGACAATSSAHVPASDAGDEEVGLVQVNRRVDKGSDAGRANGSLPPVSSACWQVKGSSQQCTTSCVSHAPDGKKWILHATPASACPNAPGCTETQKATYNNFPYKQTACASDPDQPCSFFGSNCIKTGCDCSFSSNDCMDGTHCISSSDWPFVQNFGGDRVCLPYSEADSIAADIFEGVVFAAAAVATGGAIVPALLGIDLVGVVANGVKNLGSVASFIDSEVRGLDNWVCK